MANDLVATGAKGVHDFRAVVINAAIREHGERKLQVVENVDQSPHADAVAIVAPGIVEDIRLRTAGAELGAQAVAECEMFEVESDIDGKPLSIRPHEVRAARDRAIAVAIVGGQTASGMFRLRVCCTAENAARDGLTRFCLDFPLHRNFPIIRDRRLTFVEM